MERSTRAGGGAQAKALREDQVYPRPGQGSAERQKRAGLGLGVKAGTALYRAF